jgi:hypothetical protein
MSMLIVWVKRRARRWLEATKDRFPRTPTSSHERSTTAPSADRAGLPLTTNQQVTRCGRSFGHPQGRPPSTRQLPGQVDQSQCHRPTMPAPRREGSGRSPAMCAVSGTHMPDDEYGDIVLGGGEPDQSPHDIDANRLRRVGGHRVAELLDVVVDDDVSPLDQPVGYRQSTVGGPVFSG